MPPARRKTARISTSWGALAALLLLAAGALILALGDAAPRRLNGSAAAIDGDTLRLAGQRIRLIGMDAPENGQTCWHEDGTPWACGEVAHQRLAHLLAGADVLCEADGHDKYRRILARCSMAGHDLGTAMVADGWALSEIDYKAGEIDARLARRGIWSSRFTSPQDWRDDPGDGDPGSSLFDWLLSWFR